MLVAGAHNIDEALQAIVDSSSQLVDAEFAALGIPGEPGQPMARFFVFGVDSKVIERIGPPPSGHGVLGKLLVDGETVRIPNLHEHPMFSGYLSPHPHITSFLGLPIKVGGQVLGDLYLGNKRSASEFTLEDEQLIGLMAAHAAVIIQNLNYQEHTRQLTLLREREEIARQLQDDVLQKLYGVGLLLGNVNLADPEGARNTFLEAQAHFDLAIENLRAHLLGLAPDS
jgi:GAF domain-containing protein